jgi:SAM-dependent methyltransferase
MAMDERDGVRREPPAESEREVRARHEANRCAWNQGATEYRRQFEETLAFLRAGGSNLHPVERANLGDLGTWCDSAIHLQCASGRDTLSLWNEGVKRVAGVDISDLHIENARRLSDALGAPATWYRCDVLDTPRELDGTAGLVYTGRGAVCWIHDLAGWARVAYRLLRPGGVFHIFDSHPAIALFDLDAETLVPTGYDYFEHGEENRGWGSNYLGDLGLPLAEHAPKHERQWTLGAMFQALRDAGLVIDRLGEHREQYYDEFPRLRPDLRATLPLTFSIMARRP